MKSAPSKGPLVGGTLTVIVTIEQDRKGRSDVMREEIRSATDALASVVEGVRRPRSIIRVVAVNYFSPALEKFQKCFCFHLATVIAIVDDIAAAEGHRRYCCGCCHKLGIKGTIALNSAIATSRYFLAEIEGPEQKSDSETEKDCRCCWILTSLHSKWIF